MKPEDRLIAIAIAMIIIVILLATDHIPRESGLFLLGACFGGGMATLNFMIEKENA